MGAVGLAESRGKSAEQLVEFVALAEGAGVSPVELAGRRLPLVPWWALEGARVAAQTLVLGVFVGLVQSSGGVVEALVAVVRSVFGESPERVVGAVGCIERIATIGVSRLALAPLVGSFQ